MVKHQCSRIMEWGISRMVDSFPSKNIVNIMMMLELLIKLSGQMHSMVLIQAILYNWMANNHQSIWGSCLPQDAWWLQSFWDTWLHHGMLQVGDLLHIHLVPGKMLTLLGLACYCCCCGMRYHINKIVISIKYHTTRCNNSVLTVSVRSCMQWKTKYKWPYRYSH